MSKEHEARLIGKKDVEHGAHEVLGGDLAYQYGRDGMLANIGFDSAMAVMSNASFGTGPHTLQPVQDLQQGIKRLS